jgi:hypothetical protein
MTDFRIPYGYPHKDMSEMDISNEKLTMEMSNMEKYNIEKYNKETNNNEANNKDDKERAKCPNMVLAMAYVLNQEWETPYEVNEALKRGTLFPSLDKPFLGGR